MNWKEELKKIKFENIKTKSPGFFILSGGYKMKLKPYKDNTTNELTKSVIDWINFSGGSANRINTQDQVRKEKVQLAFGNVRKILRYTPSTTRRGTADIHAVMQGRHISIEIKIGADKLSVHQSKEQERITGAGGLYFVAKNMDGFMQWFNQYFTKAI